MGFGPRQEEGKYFYDRFPRWSKLGNMVSDVQTAVDALETFDFIDRNNIFLLGNTVGGSVALMSASLDKRIAGAAVVSAFSPWRTSVPQVESVRTYSHIHGFLPRLGYFAETPAKVPVDFTEVIAAIAPRPLLVIAPQLDRHADLPAVSNSMQAVKNIYELYKAGDKLQFKTPREINRMTLEMNTEVAEFFSGLIK
jgi:hypothetical protein